MERSRSHIGHKKTTPVFKGHRRAWTPFANLGLLTTLVLVLICGCGAEQKDNAMAGSYYLSIHKDLRRLGRVAMVEMDSASSYPETAPEVTNALFLEIQKRQVFGVTVVRRDDPTWHALQENLDSLQALRQLLAVREALKCNGLLVGTITRYEPYPHMVVGLRLKLLDLVDGQLLWGMEQVWDSSDKSIQKRIQTYLKTQQRSGRSVLQEELVIASPLNFCKFVAYEVAETFQRGRRK